MRRRDFIAVLGTAPVFWPIAARPQNKVRRIGVLMPLAPDDPESPKRLMAFTQGLRRLGWSDDQIHVEVLWGSGEVGRYRSLAAELLSRAPEVILATGGPTVIPLQQASRSIPIVFVAVPDPVGSGFVESLARPGGNATGFTVFEYSMSGKWLELLKEIAPRITRVAVLRDLTTAAGPGQFGAIQSVAPAFGVEITPVSVQDPNLLESGLAAFSRTPNSGLIVTGSSSAVLFRDRIITLAAQNRLPAIYSGRFFTRGGGLMSYGPDIVDQYTRAAEYVDRILKGEKPADLPVQAPTKFEMTLNLRTARELRLLVPPSLLARADEVIE